MMKATARPWKQGRNFDPVTIGGHTPTPWEVDPKRALRVLQRGTDTTICSTGATDNTRDQWEANAAFIVRAANAHDALVAALEAVAEAFNLSHAHRGPLGRQIQAALKLAKEGE